MSSITDTQETKPAATAGGGLASALGMLGAGLAVVALAAATYLFVELRDARKQIGALQARVRELAATADKRTKELDLGLAAVRGQTAAVAEKAGVTAAELERTAAAARQLRDEQRKGQESLATLGGEVGKVKDDVAASKAAIEETQAQLQRAIGDLGEQSGLIARNAEELAALKRTGLRDYFEFDLAQGEDARHRRPGGAPPQGRRRQAPQVQHGAGRGRPGDREEGQDAARAGAVLPQGLAPAQRDRRVRGPEGPHHRLPEHAEGRRRGGHPRR